MRVIGRCLLFGALTACVVVAGMSSTAHGISRLGPDPADMGGGTVGYVLADQTGSIVTRTILVPLYFTDNTRDRILTVADIDLCSGSRNSAPSSGNNYRDTGANGTDAGATHYASTVPITTISAPRSGSISGYPSRSSTCYSDTKTLTISKNAMRYQADIGMYKVTVTARIPSSPTYVTGIQNHFSYSLNDGLVGYTSTADASSFGIAQSAPPNQYKKYVLPFAPPCSMQQAQTARVTLYDDDNGTAGVQPTPFVVRIQEQKSSGGPVSTIPIRATFSSGTGRATAQPNNGLEVHSGNQQYAYISATFKPHYSYSLVVESVYGVNLLQFQLPYDSIYSVAACNFDLYPHVTINGSLMTTASQTGATFSPSELMHNAVATAATTDSDYRVEQFVIPSGTGYSFSAFDQTKDGIYKYARAAMESSTTSCQWLRSQPAMGGIRCSPTLATNSKMFGGGDTTLTGSDNPILSTAGLSLGDMVCRIVTVRPYSPDSLRDPNTKTYRVSYPACVQVVKQPHLQVWGSDVRVGSGFVGGSAKQASVRGSLTLSASGPARGSWAEYGVLAPIGSNPASVAAFASGSGLSAPGATNLPGSWSHLTFSNTSSGTLGSFINPSLLGNIPDVTGYLTRAGAKAGLSVVTVTGNTDVTHYVPNQVLIVKGTAKITGDVLMSPSVPSGENAITQMVIIADSIDIVSSVSRVDAWLIASGPSPKGTINTCSDRTGNLTSSSTTSPQTNCDTVLDITGPLMARVVQPRRTGGDESTPSEIYNLRSDAYIWAYRVSRANSTLHTVYTKELPPRY